MGISHDVQGTGEPDVLLLPGWMITDSQLANMGARHADVTVEEQDPSTTAPARSPRSVTIGAELIVRQVFAC